MGIEALVQVVVWASAGLFCPKNERGSKKISIIDKEAISFLFFLQVCPICAVRKR
jgi:hypothetical protein